MASAFKEILGAIGGRKVKAEAIAAAIYALTGERPRMVEKTDASGAYIEITPTESQAQKLRVLVDGWLSQEPGNVRVNLGSIWFPLVLKRFGFWVGGLTAATFYLGRKS